MPEVVTNRIRGKLVTTVRGLDGGLDAVSPPQGVPLGAWVTADNFHFERGRAELVPGWDPIAPTGLTGIPFLIDSFDGPNGLRLMLVTSTGSYFMNGDVLSGTWDSITGMSSTAPSIWSAQYNQIWYCGGYGKTAYKWTSGSAATVAAIPQGEFGLIWANRLFVGKVNETDGDSRVYYSVLGDPETWDATHVLNEFEEAEGAITGMVPISASELAVHKPGGIWRVTYTGREPPFQTQWIPDVPGAQFARWACRGPRGTQLVGARDNVYLWDGSAAPLPVGLPVFDDFVDAQRQSLLAPLDVWFSYDQVDGVFLMAYRGSAGAGDEANQPLFAYALDPAAGSWSHRTYHARAACPFYDQWDTNEIGYRTLIAGRSSGSNHVSAKGRDYTLNGTDNIPGELKSGATTIDGSPAGVKQVTGFRLFTDSVPPTAGSVTVTVSYGDDPANLTAGTAQTVSLASGADRVVYPRETGRWFEFKILASVQGGPLAFTGMAIEWRPAGRR